MKRVLFSIGALAIMSSQALAADIYGGSTKDDPGYADTPAAIWTGWAITGSVGAANQDYDTRRTIRGEGGFFKEDTKGADRLTEDDRFCHKEGNDSTDFSEDTPQFGYKCPDGFFSRKINDEDEIAHFGADDTVDPVRYETPLAITNFLRDEAFETSGFQGGVEVSRRMQSGGWVFEAALGANFDSGDSDRSEYKTQHGITFNPDGLGGHDLIVIDPEDSFLTGEGTLEVSKDHDIYGVLRAGHTLDSDERILIGGGIGLVRGSFKLAGTHSFDGDTDGLFDTKFNTDESAVGVLFEAYGRYKISRNVDFGILGTYKDFGSISANDSASHDFDFNEAGTKGVYARVSDKVSADIDEWAVKGTLTYTFD